MAITTYGKIDRLKKDWLNSVAGKDGELTNLLERAAIESDNIARAWITVPLATADITDEVRRLNEQLAAGFYLSTQEVPQVEHPFIKQARDGLKLYYEGKYRSTGMVIVAKDYTTSPLSDDDKTELTER